MAIRILLSLPPTFLFLFSCTLITFIFLLIFVWIRDVVTIPEMLIYPLSPHTSSNIIEALLWTVGDGFGISMYLRLNLSRCEGSFVISFQRTSNGKHED